MRAILFSICASLICGSIAQANLPTNIVLTCAHMKLPYTLVANAAYGHIRLIDQEYGSIAIQFHNLRVKSTENQIYFLTQGQNDLPETLFIFTQTTEGFGTGLSNDDMSGSTSRYRCVSTETSFSRKN